MITASPETGVQRVDRLGIEACNRELTDSRPDVLFDLADVVDARCALDIEDASQRSSSWFTVALVRGLRRSSTWLRSLVKTLSASRSVSRFVRCGLTVSRNHSGRLVIGSTPP